jgi:hypothetical protein
MRDPLSAADARRKGPARKDQIWSWPAFGLALALLLLGFVGSSLYYPYYHLWDGDAVPCIDTLLIISGQPPAHVHHTAFGVYLILVPLARAGHALGWISLGGLNDLETSLSPYSGAAEFMTGMKLAYPFVVTVLLLALWATLALTFRPRPIVALALLIFLGMQEVMFWGASMIRSETASLMYWAIAMLFLVLAARSDRFPRRTACMFVAGLLFGLAFLTKLQAAPHVVIGALFYLWLTSFKSENPPAVGPPAARWTSAALALFGLVTFSIVAWAAWKMPLEISGAMQGEQTYFWAGNRGASFTLFRGAGFPIWLALATLSILSVALPRWRGAPPAALAWLHLSAAAAAGFVAVLFLHLLFFADLSEGWRYLLVDFKTAFLRGREQFTDTSLNRNHLDSNGRALPMDGGLALRAVRHDPGWLEDGAGRDSAAHRPNDAGA